MDTDQERRERAYRIWEDEGRPDGKHEDHWRRAEEPHAETGRQADEVTEANQNASDEFNGKRRRKAPGPDVRPPSTVAPD
ncbi:DUF2934 domain-containing protein [Rhizobium cauense]|uniref:DUF2934 domain-containing protein n=1 Tax=Rhizobium cauense TaxID=1166683 RepID=UPI001C6DEC84|nr:DUF2934 domain-containing protein [Rhizobium cauense]MBW9115565.1 DUF2934 domain-containing protein [Rhizobium cauense]